MFKLIHHAVNAGLWSANKPIVDQSGDSILEDLGYKLFYKDDGVELYFVPGIKPVVLIYRTDEVLFPDINIDLQIEGKGIICNEIIHKGYDFAESLGIETIREPIPKDIPKKVAMRCMAVELCKPFEIQLPNGEYTGVNYKNYKYLMGDLYENIYHKPMDLFGLNLGPDLEEWSEFDDPLFTPTTNCSDKNPLKRNMVIDANVQLVETSQFLFDEAYRHCLEKLYVLPYVQMEFFINSMGNPVLGGDLFNPETSIYIYLINFEMENYSPVNKSILERYARECGWYKIAEIFPGQKVKVELPDFMKRSFILSHESILKVWS